MKCEYLYGEFKKFEGQPIKVFTDDGKVHCGIDLAAFDDSVRILEKCGRTLLLTYAHIDAVAEPQMRLERCCRGRCACRGENDRDYDDDNGYDGDGDYDDDDRCNH